MTVFTIVTKTHLAYARSLGRRLQQLEPQSELIVFLADRADGRFDPHAEPFRVVLLDQLIPEGLLVQMAAYYTAYEFSNALKPFAHLFLATHSSSDRWIYLDSDVFLNTSFRDSLAELDNCWILSTPHVLKPSTSLIGEEYETMFLRVGVYNGGFLAVRNGAPSRAFFEWWRDRLVWHCLHNVPGIEADQSWLNYAPYFFEGFRVLKDPALNVAFWNLHERTLELSTDQRILVDGAELKFFHFSGWSYLIPDRLSKYSEVVIDQTHPALLHMRDRYQADLLQSGIEETSRWGYSFSHDSKGLEITPMMRRRYRDYCHVNRGSKLEHNLLGCALHFSDQPRPVPRRSQVKQWVKRVAEWSVPAGVWRLMLRARRAC